MATQSRIGWRPYVTQVVNAIDADAQAFIAAAGITNLTQAAAINTLVNDLKTYGLWTKMKALYPMVGGSATSHKFNLKDPRDLDAAYRLVFNGGWVHSSTGALPNGTTAYADTKLNPFGVFNNTTYAHLSYYSRTSSGFNNSEYGMGSNTISPNSSLCFVLRRANNLQAFYSTFSNSTYYYTQNSTSTDGSGLFVGTQQGANIKLFKQNILQVSNTQIGSSTPPNLNIFIGSLNLDGLSTGYTNKESAFASIGDGLSDTEATNFYKSVQKFQTTLGRQIGAPIVSDTDAQAFLNAAAITDLGQANAVNTLVIDLKAAGVWTKMKALYPFVGGTAAAHKFNLKDPRDLDAAYRLTFTGGWTHTAGGALSNGTTGYANTFYGAGENITNGNGYLGYYTNSTTDASVLRVSNMASIETSIYQGSGVIGYQVWPYSNTTYTTSLPGLNMGGRFTSGSNSGTKLYKNGTLVVTQYPTFGNIGTNKYFYLAARNTNNTGADGFGVMNFQFTFMSDTLTDSEASVFYTAVQKYQTSLGRQSGTPVLATGQTAGLLDTYSGASVAYSLRKLRNGYYGNAIRVRRSSDNSEQDIAFKADGTLDTVSLLAFVGSVNGFVTTWYDQSGNGYNAYQSTAINQPLIVSSGLLTTNGGKPAIRCASSTGLLINQISLGTTHSMFAVIDWISGNKEYFGSFGNSWAFYQVDGEYKANGTVGRTNASFTTNRFLGTLLRVNTQLQYYQNSTTLGSPFTISSNNSFNLSNLVGEDYNWGFAGDQQEAIIYTSSMASSRIGIESNINSYYSIY